MVMVLEIGGGILLGGLLLATAYWLYDKYQCWYYASNQWAKDIADGWRKK